MTIGEKIRYLREEKAEISQKEMGKKLNKSQRAISRLETGESHLTDEDIIAYSKYFNVSADYILGLIQQERQLYKMHK